MIAEEEAIEIARRVAKLEGWPWLDPVSVSRKRSRSSTDDKRSFDLVVNTNVGGVDCNLYVIIDEDTGEVKDGSFHGYPGLPVGLTKNHNKR